MIYATGSHFQSVMQEDHEFFVDYVNALEAENHAVNPQLAANVHGNSQEQHGNITTEKEEEDRNELGKMCSTPSSLESVERFQTHEAIRKMNETPEEKAIKNTKGKKEKNNGTMYWQILAMFNLLKDMYPQTKNQENKIY